MNISVPMYTIQTPRFNIPIDISYHASGIKVTEVASWVGLGWALNTGGEITRQVMGNPDDRPGGYLSSANVLRTANFINIQQSNSDIFYIQNVLNGDYDGEPDIFSYTFPGGSGHFLFNSDKTSLIKIPEDKNKITVDFPNNRITITDENGNTYIFGTSLSGVQSIESSTTDGPSTVGPDNTAWMLTNIISADKSDTITFNYASSYSMTYQDIYDYRTVDDDHMYPTGGIDPYPTDTTCGIIYQSGPGSNTQGTIDTYNTEYKLSEIDIKNGKVIFSRAPAGRLDILNDTALQKITVYYYNNASHTYQSIKTATLFQSYFNNNDRLRLDSLQITGTGIAEPETYRFSYNPILLPPPLSLLQDYWGYYNSNPGTTLIPQMQIPFEGDNGTTSSTITVGDANRNADTSRVKACSLEKISYPTRGYTQFVYESNQFDLNNQILYGGGLRIAEILNYDGIYSAPQVTYFKYGINQCGYGDFNIPGPSIQGSLSYSSERELADYCNGEGYVETIRQRTYSSIPDYSFNPLDGSSVFYPTVTEYIGDSTGLEGKTVYNFEYFPDILNFFVPMSNKTHIQTYIWRRGHLLDKTVYDKNNHLLYQENNTYSIIDEKLYDSISIIANQYMYYAESPVGGYSTSDPNIQNGMLYQYGSYSIQTGLELLTNSTETTYNQSDPSKSVTVSTNYQYDTSNYMPSTITFANSKGENDITHLTYPPDYSISNTPTLPAAQGIQYLQNNHVIAPVIEKYQQIENADGSNLRTTGGILTTYLPALPLPDTLFQLQLSASSTNFSPTQITYNSMVKNSAYFPRVMFDQYDGGGNILQQHQSNDVNHSYIWDYNNEYPIASVTNASEADIAYTSFEADGKGNWTFTGTPVSTAGGITGSMAYPLSSGAISKSGLTSSTNYIVSYWLYSGGSVSVSGGTESNNITGYTAGNWTYHEVTITGATSISISGSGYIDELRLYPADAQMTTYTYQPLAGMTSQCGPDNKILYYDYDGLGRLQDVKDINGNIIKTYNYHYSSQ